MAIALSIIFVTSFIIIALLLLRKKPSNKLKVDTKTIKFKYEIPAGLLDYLLIDVCYNKGETATHNALLSTTGETTCSTNVIPATIPLVFQCKRTNRPPTDNLFRIRMSIYIGNTVTMSHYIDVTINDLLSNPLKRTYAVIFDKNGKITYQLPK